MTEIQISPAEEKFCMHKLDKLGSFYTSLINTIFRADDNNLQRLRLGFPEIVDVIIRYRQEVGYWDDLRSRWNSKNSTYHQITY